MSKPEKIVPGGDKRYIRRDDKGPIKTSVDGALLSADAGQKPKADARPRRGDRGDHRTKR